MTVIKSEPILMENEIYQRLMDDWRKIIALTFSVDINELDDNKVRHYQDIIKDRDGVQYRFEPCPPNEPVGEVYNGDDELIGYLM